LVQVVELVVSIITNIYGSKWRHCHTHGVNAERVRVTGAVVHRI